MAKKSVAKYQPTEREKAAANRQVERRKEIVPGVRFSDEGEMAFVHEDQKLGLALILESCGTADISFLSPLLGQLANVTSKGQEVSEANFNFVLSVIRDIKPRDQLEAMLASQMACVHMASMTFARRLNHVESIQQQDSAEKAYNKLLRTFTSQMEALRKYRTGGEQKVTVQHVQVNEGGQAIVGNVSHNQGNGGGGGAERN